MPAQKKEGGSRAMKGEEAKTPLQAVVLADSFTTVRGPTIWALVASGAILAFPVTRPCGLRSPDCFSCLIGSRAVYSRPSFCFASPHLPPSSALTLAARVS